MISIAYDVTGKRWELKGSMGMSFQVPRMITPSMGLFRGEYIRATYRNDVCHLAFCAGEVMVYVSDDGAAWERALAEFPSYLGPLLYNYLTRCIRAIERRIRWLRGTRRRRVEAKAERNELREARLLLQAMWIGP